MEMRVNKKLIGQLKKPERDIMSVYCFGVRAKNERVKNNNDSNYPSNHPIPVLHDSGGGNGDRGRGESLGRVDSVDSVLGVCSSYGLAMYKKVDGGMFLPKGFEFDLEGV